MSFLSRNLKTIVKTPFTIVADLITLGNMGEESYTEKLIKEHRVEKQ